MPITTHSTTHNLKAVGLVCLGIYLQTKLFEWVRWAEPNTAKMPLAAVIALGL